MSDDYTPDPDWDYGFRLDDDPAVYSHVFGLPITSAASARHAAEKSYWDHYEIVRHPKGSKRNDDWSPAPTEGDET